MHMCLDLLYVYVIYVYIHTCCCELEALLISLVDYLDVFVIVFIYRPLPPQRPKCCESSL